MGLLHSNYTCERSKVSYSDVSPRECWWHWVGRVSEAVGPVRRWLLQRLPIDAESLTIDSCYTMRARAECVRGITWCTCYSKQAWPSALPIQDQVSSPPHSMWNIHINYTNIDTFQLKNINITFITF